MTVREIRTRKTMDGDRRRRWFSDSLMDLYFWEDEAGEIVKFQLCYKVGGEHAFTWDVIEGFSHHRVDDGEQLSVMKQTAILVSNGTVNGPVLSALLHGSRNGIEPRLYECVLTKIFEYEND